MRTTLTKLTSQLSLPALLLPLLLAMTSCSIPSLYKNNGAISISGLIYYVLALIAIFDIFKQSWSPLKKIVWTVIVLVPLGLILYYLVSGREKK